MKVTTSAFQGRADCKVKGRLTEMGVEKLPLQLSLHSSCSLFPNLTVKKQGGGGREGEEGAGEGLLPGKKDQKGERQRRKEIERGEIEGVNVFASMLSFVVLKK